MTQSNWRLVLTAGLAFPLAMATAGLAQTPTASGTAPDARSGHHPWRDPAARSANRARRLRDSLQLRPDQESALGAFIQAMAPTDHGWGHRDGKPDGASPDHRVAVTTPERLDRMAAMMDKRRAAFTAHAAAVKRFYAQLSPAQQKAFDIMGHGHFGHGGGERGEFGHGHHPMGGPGRAPGEGGGQAGAE